VLSHRRRNRPACPASCLPCLPYIRNLRRLETVGSNNIESYSTTTGRINMWLVLSYSPCSTGSFEPLSNTRSKAPSGHLSGEVLTSPCSSVAGSLATVTLRLLAIMVTGFVVVTGTALWLGPWGASAVAPDLAPPKLQSSAQELAPVIYT